MTDQAARELLVRTWLHGRANNTVDAYRRDIAQMFAAIGKPMAEVTIVDLQAWADRLTADGLSGASRRRKLAVARSYFRYACEVGALSANPATQLRIGQAASLAPERILTAEQVQRLMGSEPDARRRALLRLLYVCGLRASEACGLMWRQLTPRPKGGEAAIVGKGGKAATISIPPLLWRELMALNPSCRPDAPVIAGRDGGQLDRAAVHRIVKRAAKRIGLPQVSAHWLRHAHVSHALDRGVPVHVVQQTVRHSDLRTTTRYSHVRPGESSAAALDS